MPTGVKDNGYAVRRDKLKEHEEKVPRRKHAPRREGMFTCAEESASTSRTVVQDFVTPTTEKKFIRLKDEWKSKRGPESSPVNLAMHPAYLKIIGMGQAAIPLLLRELERQPDMWFLALRSITEEDPVSEEHRGNVKAMAGDWVEWGRESGYQW
jgi:hypothetical protein